MDLIQRCTDQEILADHRLADKRTNALEGDPDHKILKTDQQIKISLVGNAIHNYTFYLLQISRP